MDARSSRAFVFQGLVVVFSSARLGCRTNAASRGDLPIRSKKRPRFAVEKRGRRAGLSSDLSDRLNAPLTTRVQGRRPSGGPPEIAPETATPEPGGRPPGDRVEEAARRAPGGRPP